MQSQHRCEQQHRGQRRRRGDERRLLRPAARGAHDRGLRCAAAGRHRAEEARRRDWPRRWRRARGSRRSEDPPGLAKARPAAIVSVKLISAIPSAPGRSCSISAGSGSVSDGKALRNQSDRRHPERLQAEEPRRGDAAADCDQGRRRMRPQPLHADQHRERRDGHRQRDAARYRAACCATLTTSVKNPCFVMWMPRSFGTWSSTITEPDARLEARQHRRGDEVRHEPQTAAAAPNSIAPTSAVSVAVAVTSLCRIAVRHRPGRVRCRRVSPASSWS